MASSWRPEAPPEATSALTLIPEAVELPLATGLPCASRPQAGWNRRLRREAEASVAGRQARP